MTRIVDAVCACGWNAVRLYRLSDWLHRRGNRNLARLISTLNRVAYGVDIAPGARIGPGLNIVHGNGIVIHSKTVIGDRCVIFQNVTIGERGGGDDRAPRMGNDVRLYPGSVVIGPITVGDGARIGANTSIFQDLPAGATVRAAPSQVLSKEDD